MNEDTFWQLVQTGDNFAEPQEIAENLKIKLAKLNNQQLAEFDRYFAIKMRYSYTWKLWGAVFVIAGCDSEYAFSEFRCWLISRGQEVFEKTCKNPDCLAGFNVIPVKDNQPWPYLDDYDLIPGLIFEERTGEELAFIPSGQNQPEGKRFKNKASALKLTYPKLFSLYWHQ